MSIFGTIMSKVLGKTPASPVTSTAAPSAQTSGTTTTPIDDFRALVAAALNDAASKMKAGNAARAAERADVAAVLKSGAFKSVVGDDTTLLQQAADAQSAIRTEESDDKQAEETLAKVSKAAVAATAQISKLAD
jgi:hypothetical protein